ncbi:hypothetical protein OROHE_001673 [Orobanche hederae]
MTVLLYLIAESMDGPAHEVHFNSPQNLYKFGISTKIFAVTD